MKQTTLSEEILDTIRCGSNGTQPSIVIEVMFDKRYNKVKDIIDRLISWGEIKRIEDAGSSTQYQLTESINSHDPFPENVSGCVWNAYIIKGQNQRTASRLFTNRRAATEHFRQMIGGKANSLTKINFLNGVWINEDIGDGQTAVLRCEPVFEATPHEQ